MSHAEAHARARELGPRLVQGAMLLVLFALFYGETRAVPEIAGELGTIAAVGFLLLTATLMSELVELVGIPHLTGYLLAGTLAGPYVLKLIDHGTAHRLSLANSLALALIAFEGGAELRIETLRRGLRSASWAIFIQSFGVLILMTLAFFVLKPIIPFARGLDGSAFVAVAVLWGVMGITRSPSAVLGVLSQTKATGPVATFTLTFVMLSDVVVVILLAMCMSLAQSLVDPSGSFSLSEFSALGREILGSVSIGTSLGLVLAAYIKLVNRQLIVVFLALGFGVSEVFRYLQYDPLLAFMVAGFVVQNLSQQGEKFLHSIQRMGNVVYVIFFATAGAELDVPLVRRLWPAAIALCAARGILTWCASRAASKLAGDPPPIKRWGFAGLISQAGLALGLAALVARRFPAFGEGFRALAVATIALNELVGPILFKLALDRSGETSATPAAIRPSLIPPSPEG